MSNKQLSTKKKQPTYPDWVISLSQIIVYLLGVLPVRAMHRAERKLPENIHTLKKGSLVAANHQSFMDPFFVIMSLPFVTFLRLIPIRFPTSGEIFDHPKYNPRFFPVLKLLGCFSIGKNVTQRMAAIFYVRELLQARKTVFLFPEGKITQEKNVRELKSGIDFFIKDCVNVMFVRLRGFNGIKRKYFVKNTYSVTFGEVFEPPLVMTVDEMREYLEQL